MMADRFNATLKYEHAQLATTAWPLLQAGQPLPPDVLKALGDYIGAGNYWSVNQAGFVPVGYHREGANFAPDNAPPIVPTLDYAIAWGDIAPIKTTAFRCEAVLAIQFTVPADAVPGATAGFAVAAEWAGPQSFRQMTISSAKADFRPADPTGANGPFAVNNGSVPTVEFNAGTPPSATVAALVPGRTYYVNLRNYSVDLGHATCAAGALVNVIVQFNWPR